MATKDGVLVAVNGTVPNDCVMEQAIEQALLKDATLVVANVMPTGLFDSRQRALAEIPNLRQDGFTYTRDQAEAEATSIAARAAHTAIGDIDVDCVAVGVVGKLGPSLLELAEEHGCGTIMLAEERSWWRRRLGWGDRTLARKFAGQVVLVPQCKPLLVHPDPIVVEP